MQSKQSFSKASVDSEEIIQFHDFEKSQNSLNKFQQDEDMDNKNNNQQQRVEQPKSQVISYNPIDLQQYNFVQKEVQEQDQQQQIQQCNNINQEVTHNKRISDVEENEKKQNEQIIFYPQHNQIVVPQYEQENNYLQTQLPLQQYVQNNNQQYYPPLQSFQHTTPQIIYPQAEQQQQIQQKQIKQYDQELQKQKDSSSLSSQQYYNNAVVVPIIVGNTNAQIATDLASNVTFYCCFGLFNRQDNCCQWACDFLIYFISFPFRIISYLSKSIWGCCLGDCCKYFTPFCHKCCSEGCQLFSFNIGRCCVSMKNVCNQCYLKIISLLCEINKGFCKSICQYILGAFGAIGSCCVGFGSQISKCFCQSTELLGKCCSSLFAFVSPCCSMLFNKLGDLCSSQCCNQIISCLGDICKFIANIIDCLLKCL